MVAGDCQVVGMNMDSDDFAIVLLAPMSVGHTLHATDDGWKNHDENDDIDLGSGAAAQYGFFKTNHSAWGSGAHLTNYEGHATFTATDFIPAGTVLSASDFVLAHHKFDFGNSADQLLVYQGSREDPTFICALDNTKGYAAYYCENKASPGWHHEDCPHELCEDTCSSSYLNNGGSAELDTRLHSK